MEFLVWLKNTPFAQWVLLSAWANPILLCFHAVGMALVVGCGLMTSLRVLGYGKSLPIAFFRRLFGLAWAGVALNAASGIVLFIVDGNKYIGNWTFQLKLAFIAAAGLATAIMWRVLNAEPAADAPVTAIGPARVVAVLAILFWLSAVTAGRMIAYTMQPGPG